MIAWYAYKNGNMSGVYAVGMASMTHRTRKNNDD